MEFTVQSSLSLKPVVVVPTLRPISAELDVLTRSDGSAIYIQGGSAVLSSVNGPIEVSNQFLDTNKAYVDVIYRPKAGIPGVGEKYKEKLIRNLCESSILTTLYPRTSIAINAQEMDDHGGILACAVNSICLALINSGLEMKFQIAAIYCSLDHDNNLQLDPHQNATSTHNRNNNKTKSCQFKASFTFVFDNSQKNVIGVITDGKFSLHQYNNALALCREASDKVFDFYKEIIKKFANVI